MHNDKIPTQALASHLKPFSSLPADEAFFVLTSVLENYAKTLISIAKSGTSIGLVKGDSGAGKTSFARYLAAQLRPQADIKLIEFDAQQELDLVPALADKIGISTEALGNEPRKRVIEHLTRLRNSGTTVVLIIDNAHRLNPQALHLVIRLGLSPTTGQNGLMHTLMFAESEIEERLWLSAITDPLPLDRLYTLVLPPLNADQTRTYLNHRLTVVGWDKTTLFNQAEAVSIQRKAEGLPKLINELAERRLRHLDSGKPISLRLPKFYPVLSRRVLLAAIAGLSVVAVALLMWRYTVFTSNPSQVVEIENKDKKIIEQLVIIPPENTENNNDLSYSALSMDLNQQDFPVLESNTYSIQKVSDTLSTPATPNNLPIPSEPPPHPQNSLYGEITPKFSSSMQWRVSNSDRATAKNAVVALSTPRDLLSPKAIGTLQLKSVPQAIPVAATQLTDTAHSQQLTQSLGDRLVDHPLRAQETTQTPSMPTLKTDSTEPVISLAQLPSTQPLVVAQALPTSSNSKPQSSFVNTKNSVKPTKPPQQLAKIESETIPLNNKNTTATESHGQRISLTSVRREKWLKQRKSSEYVIQILAGPNENDLRQFIANNRFPTTPSYYLARNGQYKLLLPYSDQQQARQALNKLPEALRRYGKPWVRSITAVKQDMQ